MSKTKVLWPRAVATSCGHAVATSIVFDRVQEEGLLDTGPQKDPKDCDVCKVVEVNENDRNAIRIRYKILLA